MYLYKSDIPYSLALLLCYCQYLFCSLRIGFTVSNFFPSKFLFIHTLWCSMPHSFISNPVSIHDGTKISRFLTKSIQAILNAFKKCHEVSYHENQCFSEKKRLTIFFMNLNCNWNAFRWRTKIIFWTSNRRLKTSFFFLGRTDQFWTYKRRSF